MILISKHIGLIYRSKYNFKFNGGITARPTHFGYRSVGDPHGIRLFMTNRNREYNSKTNFIGWRNKNVSENAIIYVGRR